MTLFADRYELGARLGQGTTSEVFRALDRETGRTVALKRSTAQGEAARLLFLQEYWALKRLAHPGLPEALDVGQAGDTSFFTLALVEGPEAPAGPLEVAELKRWLTPLCHALGYLHERGLVHGDLKPQNLRATADGQVVLLDLGFLQPVGQAGKRRGTLAYMAPEVLRGAPVDPRADIYALGVMAYQWLTGRLPFEDPDPLALVHAHLHKAPVPLKEHVSGPGADLDAAVMACLAKAPQDRPATPQRLLARLGWSEQGGAYLAFSSELYGRDDEREALGQHVRDRLARSAPALVAWGPAGCGKSRLLAELGRDEAWTAHAESPHPRPVLAAAGSGDAAFQVLAQLLGAAEGPLADAGISPGDERWAALRAIATGWGTPPPALEPGPQQNRLRQALSLLLAAIAGTTGLVVAVDDWDRADEASRRVLGDLAAAGEPAGVAWILTQVEAPKAPFAGLAVGPLAPEAVAALVTSALDQPPPAELLAFVAERGRGLPGAVRQLLVQAVRGGALAFAHGAWRLDLARAEALPLAPGVAAGLRLDELSPAGLATGRAAAVWGACCTLGELRALAGTAAGEGLAALEALGLVAREGERVTFRGLAREALLAELPAGEAREIARRAVALCTATDLAGLTRLPRLKLAAGEPDAASAVLAAVRAHLAANTLDTARDLLEALPGGIAGLFDGRAEAELPAPERQEAMRLAADLARMRGDLTEALARYDAAIALARDLGLDAALGRELNGASRAASVLSRKEQVRTLAGEAVVVARRLSDAALEARALMTLGRLDFFGGHAVEAREAYERAVELARDAGAASLEADALGFLGAMSPAGDAAGRALLLESLARQRALQNPSGVIEACINLGDRTLLAGALAEAEALFVEALATCRRIGSRLEEPFPLLNLAQTHLELGQPRAALADAGRAHMIAGEANQDFPAGYALALCARARLELGQYAEARADLARAAELAATNQYLEAFVRQEEAHAALVLGDAEAARVAIAAARALAETAQDDVGLARVAWLAGRRALLLGDLASAHDQLARGLAVAQAQGARVLAVQVEIGLAYHALRRGAPSGSTAAAPGEAPPVLAEALALARNARAAAEALGAAGLAAEARWVEAEALRRGGELPAAHRHFARVVADTDDLPLWQALGRLGLGASGFDAEAAQQRQLGDRQLRALIRDAASPGFTSWPERTAPAQTSADAAAGLPDALALLGTLRQASSLRQLLDGLLERLLAAAGVEVGALTLYRELHLDQLAAVGLDSQQVLESEPIDQAYWLRSPQLTPESWALPLMQGDTVLGVLYLAGVDDGRYALMRHLVEVAGFLLEQFLQMQAFEERVERVVLGAELAKLAIAGDATTVVARGLTTLLAHTGAERAFLLERDAHGELVPRGAQARGGKPLPLDTPISRSVCSWVTTSGEPLRLLDAQQMENWQQQQSILALGLRTIVAVPVADASGGAGVAGVLYVDSSDVVDYLGAREQGLLAAAAEVFAAMLAASRSTRTGQGG